MLPANLRSVPITLLASAARGASGNTAEMSLTALAGFTDVPDPFDNDMSFGLRAQLNVTAAAGTTPTLDVVIEDTLDGTNWNVVGTFTQKTAVAREVINIAARGDAQPVGFAWPFNRRRFRLRWTVGGTGPSFTFDVAGLLL